MISNTDKADLADLSMRALDTIIEDYGDEAELTGASLIFEVRIPGDDGWQHHGNYKSLKGMSPRYCGGLHQTVASWLLDTQWTEPD